METHKLARMTHAPWPGRKELEHAAKGRFALNAQAVQQIGHAFLANIETTRTLRREHPEMRMKYPLRRPSTARRGASSCRWAKPTHA